MHFGFHFMLLGLGLMSLTPGVMQNVLYMSCRCYYATTRVDESQLCRIQMTLVLM